MFVQITFSILLIVGGILMILGGLSYANAMKYETHLVERHPKNRLTNRFRLSLFFVFALIYFVGVVLMFIYGNLITAKGVFLFLGAVLTALALFAFLETRNILILSKNINQSDEKLESVLGEMSHLNADIESQVNDKISQVVAQDKLLSSINDIATLLLDADTKNYNNILFKCLEKLALTVEVDRVYIWSNHMVGDELYTTQIEEWSGGAEPQQGNELTVSVPFPDDWYPNLSNNLCVNGIVSEMPEYERTHLEAQGILSVLIVPVFFNEEFWGFVGFDDCQNERHFSETEESLLRSGSLLIATSLLRNEMNEQLINASEEARSSAKAKSQFLANMSHEMRTPINAITGMTTIASRSDDINEIKKSLHEIDNVSKQLLSLINDVLDMSKIEEGKLQLEERTFSLSQEIRSFRSVVEPLTDKKSQKLTITVDENVPPQLIGDAARVMQVVLNLASNASKFTPIEGTIDIHLYITSDETEHVNISVKDNGIGISPENLERIFNTFDQADRSTSRKYGGSGLGLAISRNLASLMGGEITVVSTPEQGSTFTFTFPLKRGDEQSTLASDTPEKVDPANYDFSDKCILLVEDIEINRQIVIAMLADTGAEVVTAVDGIEAVEKFRSDPEKYDLIYMDIQMPNMDGYEASQAIRSLNLGNSLTVPIIAMTANAFSEDVARATECGMNYHISKPIDFNLMIEKTAEYLRK